MTPAVAVSRYLAEKKQAFLRQQKHYANPRLRFSEAIALAAEARGLNGKESHQRRIPQKILNAAGVVLVANAQSLRQSKSFDDLHSRIDRLLRAGPNRVWGIGELAVYDTALRIGAYLGLQPLDIYLHAGARVGARKLGIRENVARISKNDLPAEFKLLKPAECENCLCIYFAKNKRRPSPTLLSC